jgi:phosphatidate cytidylyltransferase
VTDQPDAAVEPAAKKSKAGRNLPAAIGVGVAIGAIALLTLFTWKWTFAIFGLVAVTIGIYEVVNAFAAAGIKIARTPIYLGAVATVIMAYQFGVVGHIMVFGLMVISALIWRIRRGTDGYVKDVTATVFTAAYLPFMLGFAILILAAPLGPQLTVVFVALTISNDIGGYATGVLFGKHPIAPQVSPKKSWEGLAGSAFFQAAVGAWLFVWLLDAPWWQGVIAGLIMTVTATAGDFTESAIKRDLGVKDLGNILPGHGGVMDRLDSLIPNAFVAWLLFAIFGLIPAVN